MFKSFSKKVCGTVIRCHILKMGKDYSLSIFNDNGGHVGSVVMSIPRKSLSGEGISATSSILNRLSHKDDVIALKVAQAVAVKSNACAVCTCGIHMDSITPDQVHKILSACNDLTQEILENIS